MSVVLSCLAVIGKILLVILLVVIGLLLLVLLVPVRYQAEGTKEKEEIDACVRVTWLLHFLSFKFSFAKHGDKTGKEMELSIAGISLQKIKKKRAEKRRSAHKEQRKKELERLKKEDPEKYRQLREEAQQRKKARTGESSSSGAAAAREEVRSSEPAAKAENVQPLKTAAKAENVQSSEPVIHDEDMPAWKKGRPFAFFRKLSAALAKLQKFLIELPGNIPVWIADFSAKVDEIYGKIQKWMDFLGDPRFTGAVSILIMDIKKLIRHVAPRSMRGYLSFGFEDPAATGKMLGVLSFVRPYIGSGLLLEPDFDEKKLEGEIHARGRIVTGYAALVLTGALMHRQVRYVIHVVRGKGETNGGDQ